MEAARMTQHSEIAALLAGTALFGALSDDQRARIAQRMRQVSYSSGREIFARGDPGDGILLVLSGRVRLSVVTAEGRELALLNAARGEIIGEIATLDGGTRTADARAVGAVEAMWLGRDELSRLLAADPALSAAAINFLCARLRSTNEALESIALHPIEVRIARFLLSAIRLRGATPVKGKVAVDLGMSQTELSLLIGASRPKVNTALQMLEASGTIERKGDAIQCDVAELSRIAGEE
jgi:CRP/FNR family transcriptional regulator, cyclic AMP receptor protein